MSALRLLVLDLVFDGHHPVYLSRIAHLLLVDGHRVVVAVPEDSVAHPALELLGKSFPDALQVVPMPRALVERALLPRFGLVERDLRTWRVLRDRLRAIACGCDAVILPYIDYVLHAWLVLGSAFGRVPWVGITMRTSFHHGRMLRGGRMSMSDRLKEHVFVRGMRAAHLGFLLTIDPLLQHGLDLEAHGLRDRIGYLADPSDEPLVADRGRAREVLGLAGTLPVVLSYGAIDRRKSIDVLIEAACIAAASRPVSVLIAGKLDDWARNWIAGSAAAARLRRDGLLIVLDAYVDDATERALFAAADLVWLKYRDHGGMSGVLVKAAAASKPVVVGPGGLMEWFTQSYGLGEVIRSDDAVEVAAAISGIDRIARACDEGRRTEWVREHSWARFEDTIRVALASVLKRTRRVADSIRPQR